MPTRADPPDDLPEPDAQLLGEMILIDNDPDVLAGMAKLSTLREVEEIEDAGQQPE